MPTPGIGDPYWYEWFVGLKCVIEMLNPDARISSVTFQCSKYATIDDVVVEYENGQRKLCYQVKHEISTSSANNLTFGKMLESTGDKPCLFKALYTGWKRATEEGASIKPVLYSNRKLLNRRSGRKCEERNYSAYSVDQFLSKTREILKEMTDYSKFEPEDSDLRNQWNELWEAVDKPEKESLLEFLSLFSVEANQPSLSEMEELLIDSLAKYFQCENSLANELFTRLLRGLTKWTTSERDSEKVTVENVLTVLGAEEDHDAFQHRLAPPFPFFSSREEFCNTLLSTLQSTDKKFIFISGAPGSGKTSIVSYLQTRTNIFYLRYHTFRPISPEQRFYDSDQGLCSMEKLWGTLLIQLRQKFLGRMRELDIPVSNRLLSREALRKKVLELLAIAARENTVARCKLFICIDGIDHAARAGNAVSFLSSIPKPSEIPDGVCFIAVGQPFTLYQEQYPSWLENNREIQYIDMPKLCQNDIKQLIIKRTPQFAEEADTLSTLIYKKTDGNNLSAAFAVEEIRGIRSVEKAYGILKCSDISDDVNQYYSHIWSHLKELMGTIMPCKVFPESYIACPLLLLNGRVNVRILSQALKLEMTISDWNLLLKRLFPLVVPTENPDEYALFHNDFRVYLQSIMHRYADRYEEMAYALAKYLLENDEGMISYVLGIPLLKYAKKVKEIPRYFNTGFVINALAEGISQDRLYTFAHDAYCAACENRDIKEYCNVYLAIKTLYRQWTYYEYYEREYISFDFPEIEQIDIDEIRVLPISQDNLAEYEVVLELCKKLYSSVRNDCIARAEGLYHLWFGKHTPLSFLSIVQDEIKDENFHLKSSEIGILLEHWGRLAASMKLPVISVKTDGNFWEEYAVNLWGNEYFACCVEKKQYDLALSAVHAGVVSRSCFAEEMERLLYDGVIDQFQSVLQRITPNKKRPKEHLLAYATQVICNCDFIPQMVDEDISARVKSIYDESCFELILQVFLMGRLNTSLNDDELLQDADAICALVEGRKTSRQQTIDLARTAALLGKYFWSPEEPSKHLKNYSIWYLTTSMDRWIDHAKACRFILFVLLHCRPLSFLDKQPDFLDALHKQLFENQQLGMYYKTSILDFYIQRNMVDPVREYILALYGKDCQKIGVMDNKAEIHARFGPYGMAVESAMMQDFSDRLRWDVVGYIWEEEDALHSSLELYELMVQNNPADWKKLGYKLYQQAEIANKSSNMVSYQIFRKISEAAAHSSLADYWELRTWNDEFRLNTDLITHAVLGIIKSANTADDLIALWLLGCGLNSWYIIKDHQEMRIIYDACIKRSEELKTEIAEIIAKLTPEWLSIILYKSEPEHICEDIVEYHSKRETDIAAITKEFSKETITEVIDSLPIRDIHSSEQIGYLLDYYEIALLKISEEGPLLDYYVSLLDKLCVCMQNREWLHQEKCDYIISRMLEVLSDDAFWKLAMCIENSLSIDNWRVAYSNMQLLLKLRVQREHYMLNDLLSEELDSQRAWVTGNDHISIPLEKKPSTISVELPSSILDVCVYILTELIDSQNARKVESAVYAIALLGQEFPTVMDSIADAWNGYTHFQKEFLLHPIIRWVIEDRCSEKLIRKLKEAYETCSNLVMKYRLHSVMLSLPDPNAHRDKIECTANEIDHSLPLSGTELRECFYDDFISLISQVLTVKDIEGIRRYLMDIAPLERYAKDLFSDFTDLGLPAIRNEPGEVFYQFEKNNMLSQIPLSEKKAWLLTSDDSLILTSMPDIHFSDDLMMTIEKECNIGQIDYSPEKLSNIVQIDVLPNEVVVAASLWLPWGQNGGVVFNQEVKVGRKWAEPDTSFDWCLGNFSGLIHEGDLEETQNSSIGNCSLFNKVGGKRMVIMGNCQLVPSSTWRMIMNCSPQRSNPLVWLDVFGKPVLRFEHIACPSRLLPQQAYVRQPILFRWICDKTWFDATLQKLDLRSYVIFETERYPSTQTE